MARTPSGRAKSNVGSKTGKPSAAEETASDLVLLEQFRWFRMALAERICADSASAEESVLQLLRQEPTLQFAEFLYLLDQQAIRSAEHVERLAALHNAYLVELSKDDAKMSRLGLNKDRLLDAIFTSDTLPRLIQQWREEPGTIDQSNFARFLAGLMSAETCRKVIVACASAGFLERRKTAFGTSVVKSNGKLEQIFAKTLREARRLASRERSKSEATP